MIKKLVGIGLVAAFAAGATVTVQAQDKKAEKAEQKVSAEGKSNRAIPFFGKINEVDQAAKTINIGKTKKRTIHITDKTKVMKDGKPATLADAKSGDDVGGSYRESADGKMEANSLRIGQKPEGKSGEKKEKKKE